VSPGTDMWGMFIKSAGCCPSVREIIHRCTGERVQLSLCCMCEVRKGHGILTVYSCYRSFVTSTGGR
jgi:hypothetical protein